MRKNGQSEVIIDNDNIHVVDNNKANKGLAYFKIFLFLALGILLTGVVSVGFSFIFNNLFLNLENDYSLITFFIILIVSFIGAFLSSFFITRNRLVTKKTSTSLICYFLYTFCMGIFLAPFVLFIKDPTVIGITLLFTSILVLSMGLIAYLSKGKGLFIVVSVISFLLLGVTILYLMTFFLFPLLLGVSTKSLLLLMFIVESILFAAILVYTAVDFFLIKKEIENRQTLTNSDCFYFALVIYSDFVRIFIQLIRFIAIFASFKGKNN